MALLPVSLLIPCSLAVALAGAILFIVTELKKLGATIFAVSLAIALGTVILILVGINAMG
jgi:hypothetical protein